MRIHGLVRSALAVLVGLGVISCTETVAPAPASIVGSYVATAFIVTPDSAPPFDALAIGASMSITIAADNTTTGSLVIPGALTGKVNSTVVSMVGTAVRKGNTVVFQQTGDSFVRDITWAITGNRLLGDQTANGATVDLELTKQ